MNFVYICEGLQAWINMKPFTQEIYKSIAVPYTVGITQKNNVVDQKTTTFEIKPGHHITVNVLPQLVSSSKEFNGLDLKTRECKLKSESDGLNLLTEYSRKGCELECAAKKAVSFCRCLPWNYPNNFTMIPICDMFGAHCFDKVMSDEKFYKQCQDVCLEDCEEIALKIWNTFFPLNLEEVCKEGSLIHGHLHQTFGKHFAFENYKALIERGSIPDLSTSYSNGSLCKHFVQNYVSFLSIESPSTRVIRSRREKRFSFYDQLGTIGGILGLFTGMSLLSTVEVFFLVDIFINSIVQDIFDLVNGYDSSSSLMRNNKDPKHETGCCDRLKTKCNEKQIQNLYVSQCQ